MGQFPFDSVCQLPQALFYQAVASALRQVHDCAEIKTPAYRKVVISVFDLIELDVTGLLPIIFNHSELADKIYQAFCCSQDLGEKIANGSTCALAGVALGSPPRSGDFQERCHSLAAFQAALINLSAWLDWSPSGGLLIHTTTGWRQQRVDWLQRFGWAWRAFS